MLTESAQLALIAMVATVFVPAMVSCWLSYLAYLKGRQNAAAINDLHIIVNDRLTQLLTASSAASRAEGVIQGTADTRAAVAIQGNVPVTVDAASAAAVVAAREVIAAAVVAARELVVRAELEKAGLLHLAEKLPLPPVVVPANTEPRETKGGGWVMEGPKTPKPKENP